ncbi:MAG: Rne/Rng family ribonuclease [Marinibacterium sp.]
MAKKMLIDATHAEETRVVVVDGNKVEEFDFESENKRQLAGNIYLAKVTRVEPSLQAAFVDYGGNRHGFLAFAEIHPDYYQIPVADREALMEEERAYAEAVRARDEEDERKKSRSRKSRAARTKTDDAIETQEVDGPDIKGMETIDLSEDAAGDDPLAPVGGPVEPDEADIAEGQAPQDGPGDETSTDGGLAEPSEGEAPADVAEAAEPGEPARDVSPADEATTESTPQPDAEAGAEASDDTESADVQPDDGLQPADPDTSEDVSESVKADESAPDAGDVDARDGGDDGIESVADDDDADDIRPPRKPRPRRYKIQEVIKVRQILLVQVVKEERGNKGAALTTYLSLAGRYCVLMPNTARGGGISRKITNATDRKKLKEIAGEIDVPQGAGLIVRTAGAKRTKAEIKRDYEYLQRLWEQIRELTLKSIAPAKIYEEGDLIKRSIRDLYNRDIDEVIVEGENGYRIAKDFMKMIMPSHAKNVKRYEEAMPLFARYQVESYLGGMFNPVVQLKSGGYIVIGVTEALVAIDVNSGRATKEGSIEETALKTNLEAAEEVARQLRLRDLAGLIVIDFIDMDERKNNSAVEKRMKDRLKTDRARIQVGRISGFGLMEMSRQRLRPGMIEATTQPCPACHGTGLIRSDDNMALTILRQIEEEGVRRRSREVLIKCPVGIANYLMNQKRDHVAQIEGRYGLSVRIEGDPHLVSPDFNMERFKTATRAIPAAAPVVVSADASLMEPLDIDEDKEEDQVAGAAVAEETTEEAAPKSKRRRRRRRRKPGKSAASNEEQQAADGAEQADGDGAEDAAPETADAPREAAPADTVDAAPQTADAPREAAPADTADAAPQTADAPREAAPADTTDAAPETADAPSEAAPGDTTDAAPETADAPREAAPGDTTDAAPETADAPREAAPADTADAAPETADAPREAAPAGAADAAPETADEQSEAAPAGAADAAPETADEQSEEAPAANGQPLPADLQPVETPASDANLPSADAPAKPKRRGWWSMGPG